MRVLIVEDNLDMARELAKLATRAGFSSDCVASLEEAREIVQRQDYALAVIDRGLPDGDGVSLPADLRRAQPSMRIMMLSVLAETREKVEGLDAGADDYMTKPFEPDELMARLRACLRRSSEDATPPLALANLSYSCATRELTVDGVPIVLQKRELALLASLLRRAGRVALRETLAEEVFGEEEDINWHTLTALVSQLRLRLKEVGADVDIHTARGLGYFIAKTGS